MNSASFVRPVKVQRKNIFLIKTKLILVTLFGTCRKNFSLIEYFMPEKRGNFDNFDLKTRFEKTAKERKNVLYLYSYRFIFSTFLLHGNNWILETSPIDRVHFKAHVQQKKTRNDKFENFGSGQVIPLKTEINSHINLQHDD